MMADEQTPTPDAAEEPTPAVDPLTDESTAGETNLEAAATETSKDDASLEAPPPADTEASEDTPLEEVKDSETPAEDGTALAEETPTTGEEGVAAAPIADAKTEEEVVEGAEGKTVAGVEEEESEVSKTSEGEQTQDEGELPKEDGEMEDIKGEDEEGSDEVNLEEADGEAEEMKGQEAGEEHGTVEPASPIPQSDTFADGERPETPVVAVTEPLSREGSPVAEVEQIHPGTPERVASPVEEEDEEDEYFDEEEEEEEGQWITREELLEMYQLALSERETLNMQNVHLQHKLAEYFRKKKTDDQRQEMDKNVTDQEQRYLKYMSNLEDLRKTQDEEENNLRMQLEELKEKRQEKLDWVEKESKRFGELKKQVALAAINSRSGKPITPKDVELYLFYEQKKEEEVKAVRLENIKLKNRLKKREQQLKAKEELAEGLHLIDFEQLKIENQTYNEKIEERNEELLKLRKKITSTVQVLTHVKEKLQFVQAENHVQKGKLRVVEAIVAQKRDVLSRTKKARDHLRIDNQRLRQKCGLLGNTSLLRDFEERKDEGDALRAKLDRLKRQHAELTLNCAGVRRKIEEARTGRS